MSNQTATTILPDMETSRNGNRMPTSAECKSKTWGRLSPHLRTPNQWLGRRKAIGCVSLEVTQRCNLDCELCYLSEMSESTLDVPLEEIKRRVDEIAFNYGPGTAVQVSGGDPTLRKEDELIEIVEYITSKDMQPALLTNGIKATRELLTKLVGAGLTDVAFHVDLTMKLRKKNKEYFSSEKELNERRKEYIERARGLGVAVIFNTTVCAKNFHELPMLIKFFCKNSDVVGMCSFQLQADTGRGSIKGRLDEISPDNVVRIVNKTVGNHINFDVFDIGHRECNRVGYSLTSNGNAYDLFYDPELVTKYADKFQGIKIDRCHPAKAVKQITMHALKNPKILLKGLEFLSIQSWRMKWDLIRSGFKVHKLSFFIHNFMHADSLDQDRIDNCSFMVMTSDGPVSMCLHNAYRDGYITKEFNLKVDGKDEVFDPVRKNKRDYWEKKKEDMENQGIPIFPQKTEVQMTH